MNKQERKLEALVAAISEYHNIEREIAKLPRGYISVKQIAGHTYYYRQWREGNKVVSTYVPEMSLTIIEQKIKVRKENEQLLRVIKKSYNSAVKSVLRASLLTNDQIHELFVSVNNDEIDLNERNNFVKGKFEKNSDNVQKAIHNYVNGISSYNYILLAVWGY